MSQAASTGVEEDGSPYYPIGKATAHCSAPCHCCRVSAQVAPHRPLPRRDSDASPRLSPHGGVRSPNGGLCHAGKPRILQLLDNYYI